MTEPPKYSLPEIERRWHVDLSKIPDLAILPVTEIVDLFLTGTELRLRKMVKPDGAMIFKLGKKYERRHKYTQPITNLYLDEKEYETLTSMGGRWLRKRRYTLDQGALDIPEDSSLDPRFEIEFESEGEAERYQPPNFVTEEIS